MGGQVTPSYPPVFRSIVMKETVVQIDEQMQIAKSKEGKYLTFVFLEKDYGMELEVVGWTRFQVPVNKPENVMGVIHLWGNEIPVKRSIIFHDQYPATMCIVIFEYREPFRHYLGTTFDGISNVINLAEKGPATVTIVETEATDCFGGSQVQYNIVESVRINE